MSSPLQSAADSLGPRLLPGGPLIAQRHDTASLPLRYVDMHTTGEPTRIIYHGYPTTTGPLLAQRAEAKLKYDHIRRQLMFEPRGHKDMYGAILRPESELVTTGQAHMAVLFTHNQGYSTMCGHATLALGRFLIDTHDAAIFPRRAHVAVLPDAKLALVHLHVPCGLVAISVPLQRDLRTSDPARPVSFTSVPSFAAGLGLELRVPERLAWPGLRGRRSVRVDVAYGGAFYGFVTCAELGFPDKIVDASVADLSFATRLVKQAIVESAALGALIRHPDSDDLGFCYGVVVVEEATGMTPEGRDAGVNLCFFADQQIDRSPTGSAVSARAALAFARGEVLLGEHCLYQSIVSAQNQGHGAFRATVVKQQELKYDDGRTMPAVNVEVEGRAFYIGTGEIIVEDQDLIGQRGFLLP